MSTFPTQATTSLVQSKPTVQRALDLNIQAIDTTVVRCPWAAGASTLRATKTILTVG